MVVTQAMEAKLLDYDRPIDKTGAMILMSGLMFRELFGYETSELHLTLGFRKYIDSNFERPKSPSKEP